MTIIVGGSELIFFFFESKKRCTLYDTYIECQKALDAWEGGGAGIREGADQAKFHPFDTSLENWGGDLL